MLVASGWQCFAVMCSNSVAFLKCRLASSNWLDACLGTESSSQSAPLLQNACVSLYRRVVSYSAVCGASIERKKRTLRLMLALA
jgi:hypothetical protein